jgi:hypothetical protein
MSGDTDTTRGTDDRVCVGRRCVVMGGGHAMVWFVVGAEGGGEAMGPEEGGGEGEKGRGRGEGQRKGKERATASHG